MRLLPVIHLALIIAAWSSPFWLAWQIIGACSIVLYVQFFLLKGCVLTNLETGGNHHDTFYHHHFSRIAPGLPKYPIWFFMRYVAPFAIPLCAYWWQVIQGHGVLITLWF